MAAKNKHRKKSKASSEVTFEPEEHDMEAENSGGEEEGDSAGDEGEDRAKQEEEEFSLDEVLRLGGTQVGLPDKTSRQAELHLLFFLMTSKFICVVEADTHE